VNNLSLCISQLSSAAAFLQTAKLEVYLLQKKSRYYITSEKCHLAFKLQTYFTDKIIRAALTARFCASLSFILLFTIFICLVSVVVSFGSSAAVGCTDL